MTTLPHRQTLPEPVRLAMCILDRASEGQAISATDIERALRMTGDVGWRHEIHAPLYPPTHFEVVQ